MAHVAPGINTYRETFGNGPSYRESPEVKNMSIWPGEVQDARPPQEGRTFLAIQLTTPNVGDPSSAVEQRHRPVTLS